MVKKREYIYICDKCKNEIKSSEETIQCTFCENIIDARKTSWSSQSKKRTTHKPNIFRRYLNNISYFFESLSYKWKIALLLFCILFFLFLPIEVYDLAFPKILLLATCLSIGFLINLELWKYSSFFKSAVVFALLSFGIFFMFYRSYNIRRDYLFRENGRTINAKILDFKTKYGKHLHSIYAIYSYSVEGKSFFGEEMIFEDEYSNLCKKDTIQIDYVLDRPRISRINENSFIKEEKLNFK